MIWSSKISDGHAAVDKSVEALTNYEASSSPAYAVPDNSGYQYIMACRVVVGEYCLGVQDALTPRVRDSRTNMLYDTTVDDEFDPSIYVTYHDAQAYPEVSQFIVDCIQRFKNSCLHNIVVADPCSI